MGTTRRRFLEQGLGIAGSVVAAGALPWQDSRATAAVQAELPSPTDAPAWAHDARILSALYDDVPNLGRAKDEFDATVLVLYLSPETTNGWCPLGSWDQVALFIEHAHRNGLKVLCYYDTTTTEEAFTTRERRSWSQITVDGKPCQFHRPHLWQLRDAHCFNTPWSDWVANVARRYVAAGADGVFLDNPHYYTVMGETCFCAACREKFQSEAKEDLGTADAAIRTAFHQKSLRDHVKRVYRAMAGAAPDRELVLTCNTSSPRNPMQCLESLGRAENVLFRETNPLAIDIAGNLRRDVSAFPRKPMWVILTDSTNNVWPHDVKTAAKQHDELLATILAAGFSPMVWSTIPSQDPKHPGFTQVSIYNQPELGKVIAKHFGAKRKA